jgi:hypothetical protein
LVASNSADNITRSPSEKSCSLRSQTVGVDLVRSELTFE